MDFADSTRVLELEFSADRVVAEGGATTLVLQLADVTYPLQLELYYRVFDDSDVIERWARIVNTANAEPIVVRQAHSANWWLPQRTGWRLSLGTGLGCETQLARQLVEAEKVVLESRRGTTSHQCQPFFALDADGPRRRARRGLEWPDRVERLVEARLRAHCRRPPARIGGVERLRLAA